MSATHCTENIAIISSLRKGRVAFFQLSGWYGVPDRLEPMLHFAKDSRCDVKFVADSAMMIQEAELLLGPPSLDLFQRLAESVRKLLGRSAKRSPLSDNESVPQDS